MPREFSSGFAILGFDADPTPGDPDAIERFADRHGAVRTDVLRALDVLGGGGQIEQGRGQAMDALRAALKSLPDKLRRTADSFGQAEQAYRTFAIELRDSQSRLDDLMRAASPIAALADSQLTDPADPASTQTQGEILAARERLSGLAAQAAQIRADRDRAAERAADELLRAAANAIPERDVLTKIGDGFQQFPFIQIIIDVAIALVALAFPVFSVFLAATALAIRTAGQVANDSFKVGTFVVDLLALVPGGSALRRADDVVHAFPFAVAGHNSDNIAASIVKSRNAISSAPLANASLVFVRETSANFGRTTLETTLNGQPFDAGKVVLTALGVGGGLGLAQLRSDRQRQLDRQHNSALPDDSPDHRELRFDAEHDLSSIQEDARERIGAQHVRRGGTRSREGHQATGTTTGRG
ncbi:hypothetical protein [Asanoa siamensis]|uniref:Uncharacterized protein n=1 Tax=Asanoa siamensis TaxID=926357 RepID=A0ABQ4D2I7_9ACTN|nr:hypothetical protein [Asanoa siamensis]GIF77733.1 hypothetical protein Asi02nite_72510 [Asanoa siamensis]